jgi:hypothetical protein
MVFAMETEIVEIEKEEGSQVILGHAGFIKTAEDLYEAMAESVPGVKFGIAFAEASGPCLVRSEGNDPDLTRLAEKNMARIAAGHTFIILFKGGFPINITNALKDVSEVVRIYCATANPVEVVVASTKLGRGVMGVVDGSASKGVEDEKGKAERRKFLRDIGYKL